MRNRHEKRQSFVGMNQAELERHTGERHHIEGVGVNSGGWMFTSPLFLIFFTPIIPRAKKNFRGVAHA